MLGGHPIILLLHPIIPQSLVIPEKFQHILRVLNTNIDGRRKIAFAITAIKVGGGRGTSGWVGGHFRVGVLPVGREVNLGGGGGGGGTF